MIGRNSNESKYPPRRFSTEEQALDKVDGLKVYGVWPGVVRYSNGTFGLTFDPGAFVLELHQRQGR